MRLNPFVVIDHVQLAMPRGGEEDARAFYGTVLGMTELAKPEALAKRGGCWFGSGDVQVHLGVEDDFRPARKAHPGLRCADFQGLLARLKQAGVDFTEDEAIAVPRAFVHDPFGNRIELVAQATT